jgi:hypothetical protein
LKTNPKPISKFKTRRIAMININRNNGVSDNEILQNEFTAFITTSLERERIKYLKKAIKGREVIYEFVQA